MAQRTPPPPSPPRKAPVRHRPSPRSSITPASASRCPPRKWATRSSPASTASPSPSPNFSALYGENVVVKHIQCANPQEAMQVKTRLAADEKFETLVHSISRNARTAALDGELPPFSRQMDTWGTPWGKIPQGFKDFAFRP